MINLYMAEIFNFSTIEKKTSFCNEWRTKSRPLFWSEGLTLPWVGKINELIVEKGEGGLVSQRAFKHKAQIYLLYNTLPPNLHKHLLKVEWTKHGAASHATKECLQTLEDWILSCRHVRPRTETALSALYSGELKQGPKEQLHTWYEKIRSDQKSICGHWLSAR